LKSLFTENREDFEKKWNDIKIVLEYGMLEDKFYENQLLSFISQYEAARKTHKRHRQPSCHV
jgi:HSP90 family molecular chaperone